MRLYGRWHKGHRRCGNAAYAPRVVKVAGLPVAYGRASLPPRGAALRPARIGGKRLACAVMAGEKYWRTPGNKVRKYRPHIYQAERSREAAVTSMRHNKATLKVARVDLVGPAAIWLPR